MEHGVQVPEDLLSLPGCVGLLLPGAGILLPGVHVPQLRLVAAGHEKRTGGNVRTFTNLFVTQLHEAMSPFVAVHSLSLGSNATVVLRDTHAF